MTQTRRRQVLRAIIEDYVNSHEPVGSKALIQRHNLKVSSATIRNDMAALEEEGLITAPHASAGRIPTEKGYRYFVDEITAPGPLSPAEKRAIHRLLDSSETVEEVYERTVKVLSHLTHQVAVLQYPVAPVSTIRRIELIPLTQQQISVVLISDSGRVLQRLVSLPEYSQPMLDLLHRQLLQEFLGKPVTGLQQKNQESATGPETDQLRQQVLEALAAFGQADDTSRLIIAGTSFLAQSTADFSSSIAPILDALEEQVTMLRLLSEMAEDARGFAVRIGTENTAVPLSETSIVTSIYAAEESSRVGVIGPTRMDYLTATSAVRGVARYVSKILGST